MAGPGAVVRREELGPATHEELSLDSVVFVYTYVLDVDTLTQVVFIILTI